MHVVGLVLWAVVLPVVTADDNLQAWNQMTYFHRPWTLTCNSSTSNVSVSWEHSLTWTKLGSPVPLLSDQVYELLNDSGVTNMLLKVRNVTSQTSGIYFCHVRDHRGDDVERIVKGLNVAGHLYEDKFDEYRDSIIRGVISAASVFVFVVGICVIDRFRYLTEEQKQKRRDRKEDRIRRLQQSQNGGIDNLAMEELPSPPAEENINDSRKEVMNTHF